ncbi:MAG: hypothetical protein LAT55_07765 [Opitutales bacterium]|nr:hypothetical protein [Opitutales bacterium]
MATVISPPFPPNAYQNLLDSHGNNAEQVFVDLCVPIAQRFLRQTGFFPNYTANLDTLLRNLWQILHTTSLPKPLAPAEVGEARDPDEERISFLLNELSEKSGKELSDALQILFYQVLVTLTQPEFKTCRLSYSEKDGEGCAVRQQKSFCEDRISGVHCEDCPYFTALSGDKHIKFLSKQWENPKELLEDHRELFLPEDFRFLRVFWFLHLRHRQPTS